MITVVGGTYRERCREPAWDELYGSGLRAACVLSSLGADVRLKTLVCEKRRLLLEAIAKQYSIDVAPEQIPETIGFFYQHGLATPEVEPDPRRVDHGVSPLELCEQGDRLLCFGLIEASLVVKCREAVYDPQSPTTPSPFRARGCCAERLAIIANRSEIFQLGGADDLAEACRRILSAENAEVVVAKLGPAGCLVVTRAGESTVPAFRTSRVFPIGSGDVFSAAFAHRWFGAGTCPSAAADFASRMAAFYCEKRAFPCGGAVTWKPTALEMTSRERHKCVYLAGPFFNAGQRWLIDELHLALKQAGLQVFSPMHDVGPGQAEDIWQPDIAGLERSGVVLACLDGLDPGTIYEVGYAQARKTPVIALVSAEKEEDLKMFRGGGCVIVDDIPTAVYQATWAATCV